MGKETVYSFELTQVEIDHPMLDLTSVSVDGRRALTLSAFGVEFVNLPVLVRDVAYVMGRSVVQEDCRGGVFDVGHGLCSLELQSHARETLGIVGCRSALLLSHAQPFGYRVAFDNEALRGEATTKVIFDWPSPLEKEYAFPTDGSLWTG
jgi:hypothetical protein